MDHRKTLPQRMDDLVRWTGLHAFATGKTRRRPLRWPATLALAAAFAGFIAVAIGAFNAGGPGGLIVTLAGSGLLTLGCVAGCFTAIFGPLKPFGYSERADEFDQALRARAHLFAFAYFIAVTLCGVLLMIAFTALGRPPAAIIAVGMSLIVLLFTILLTTPTAHASWTGPWGEEDS